MLFQINDLDISAESFRLLYAIITAAYHDKMWNTTHGILQKKSKLSRYKVRASLDELRRERLITTTTNTDGIRIILAKEVISMIYHDYTRKGASQRTRNMAEIKKSQPPKQEVKATKNCQTSSTQTSNPPIHQNTSKPSLRNTSKKTEVLTQTVNQTSTQVQTAPEKPPTKPPTTKRPASKPPASKPTTSQKLKALDKKPYITTRGTLYKFFEEWLKYYEQLSELDIACLLKRDDQKMMRYWISFQDYARCWLSLNRQIERPERDLNKIKAMKKFAALAKAG